MITNELRYNISNLFFDLCKRFTLIDQCVNKLKALYSFSANKIFKYLDKDNKGYIIEEDICSLLR